MFGLNVMIGIIEDVLPYGRDHRGDCSHGAGSHRDRIMQIAPGVFQPGVCQLTNVSWQPRFYHKSNQLDNAEASKLLERAIVLDPNYAHAYAWRAASSARL